MFVHGHRRPLSALSAILNVLERRMLPSTPSLKRSFSSDGPAAAVVCNKSLAARRESTGRRRFVVASVVVVQLAVCVPPLFRVGPRVSVRPHCDLCRLHHRPFDYLCHASFSELLIVRFWFRRLLDDWKTSCRAHHRIPRLGPLAESVFSRLVRTVIMVITVNSATPCVVRLRHTKFRTHRPFGLRTAAPPSVSYR